MTFLKLLIYVLSFFIIFFISTPESHAFGINVGYNKCAKNDGALNVKIKKSKNKVCNITFIIKCFLNLQLLNMTKLENKKKRFVALKGQPIHKGHCYLIEEMLHDASEEEIIIIGIVNPYPHEKMDMSRNRRPDNFLIERNPLTYFERAYLLRCFLYSIQGRYSNVNSNSIVITPYFIPTVFEKEQMYNYLPMKKNIIEYISDKDDFEIGKQEELKNIGVNVKFVSGLRNNQGAFYSADFLRNQIYNGVVDKQSFDKIIYNCMEQMNLFNIIKKRIKKIKLCIQE